MTPASDALTHDAILKRGKTYFIGSKRFDVGVPTGVTEEEMEYLRETAVDNPTTDDGDSIARPKFQFVERHEGTADVVTTPKTVRRPPVPGARARN
jgi:hypothetical protein